MRTTPPHAVQLRTSERLADCYTVSSASRSGPPHDGRRLRRKEDIRMEQSAVCKMVLRAAVLALGVGLSVAAGAAQRPIGDIQVFVTLPYPGHPGGLAVNGRTLYVDTSNADFDRLFDPSDEIWAFRLDTGEPVQSGL